jgi:flagellar hook-length control protein FliK
MMQARTQITLDPLLNLLGGPKSNTPSGVPSQVPADIMLFGDILGLLGNFGANQPTPTASASPLANQSAGAVLSNDPDLLSLLESASGNPAALGAFAVPINMSATNSLTASPTAKSDEPPIAQANSASIPQDQSSDVLDAFAAKVAAQTQTSNPTASFFATNGRPTAWTELPTDSIPDGAFKVVSSKVTGDQLQLELQSQNNPGTQFKLTVPTASLAIASGESSGTKKSAQPQTTGRSNRISLSTNATGAIDDLFGQLSVTELTLSNELSTETTTTSNAVKLELTANQSGRATSIALVAPRNSVRLLTSDPTAVDPQAPVTAPGSSKLNATSGSVAPAVAESNSATTGVAPLPPEDSSSFSVRPVATKWDTDLFADDTSSAIKALQSGIDRTDALSRPVDAQSVKLPVKITLPDLPKMMSGETRTLTIKLEPEHLGPARLHLSVINDTVSARLSVDTPTAKAAVERGLDQLTDQLSRAGLKVNHIEVSLRGGSYQESAYRQTNWFRSQRNQLRRASDDSLTSTAALAAVTTQRPAGYLGSSGVNVYA